jgi:hypothetical protein
MLSVKCSQFTVKTTVEFILRGVLQKTFHFVVAVPSYSLQQQDGITCKFYIIHNFEMLQKIDLKDDITLSLYISSAKYLNTHIDEKFSEVDEEEVIVNEV